MDRYATTVTTAELSEGDVVWTHGMRVRISRRVQDGEVIGFHGRILNTEAVAHIPAHFRTSEGCEHCQPGEHWRIQGIRSIIWDREV